MVFLLVLTILQLVYGASAQETRIAKADAQIDGLDSGIRLFVREKMPEDDNVVLFLHGATAPNVRLRLGYKDYSWADWMVKRGYVAWMGGYRNYGFSSREKAMEEPAASNQPVTRVRI